MVGLHVYCIGLRMGGDLVLSLEYCSLSPLSPLNCCSLSLDHILEVFIIAFSKEGMTIALEFWIYLFNYQGYAVVQFYNACFFIGV